MAAPTATTSSGIDALVGLFAEEFFYLLLHQGHAGLAADKDDFINLRGGFLPESASA